jgi:hypothetical protein
MDTERAYIKLGKLTALKLATYPQQVISRKVGEITATAAPISGLSEMRIPQNGAIIGLYSRFFASANTQAHSPKCAPFYPLNL